MKKTILTLLVALVLLSLKSSAQTTTKDTTSSFSIADSATFVGRYKYEGLPFDYMTISVQDEKLYFSGGEYAGPLNLVKDKKDVFDANGVALFTFQRDDENKVTGLQIDYGGETYKGKREMAEK